MPKLELNDPEGRLGEEVIRAVEETRVFGVLRDRVDDISTRTLAASAQLDAPVAGTVLAFKQADAAELPMDGLNHTGRQPTEFSELTAGGLILWRLATAGQADLWCLAFELPEGLAFVLEDHPEGSEPSRITEQHADIVTLVNRAEMLKLSLLRSGWTEVDIE